MIHAYSVLCNALNFCEALGSVAFCWIFGVGLQVTPCESCKPAHWQKWDFDAVTRTSMERVCSRKKGVMRFFIYVSWQKLYTTFVQQRGCITIPWFTPFLLLVQCWVVKSVWESPFAPPPSSAQTSTGRTRRFFNCAKYHRVRCKTDAYGGHMRFAKVPLRQGLLRVC